MGHYDDQIEEDYARQRAAKDKEDRIKHEKYQERVAEAQELLEQAQEALGDCPQVISNQFHILNSLLIVELM